MKHRSTLFFGFMVAFLEEISLGIGIYDPPGVALAGREAVMDS